MMLKVFVCFLVGISLGDVFDWMFYYIRLYEVELGSVNKMFCYYFDVGCVLMENYFFGVYKKLVNEMVCVFDNLLIINEVKFRVGVVGEIFVKFYFGVNNNIVDVIEDEGGEVVVFDLIDFILYCCYDDYFVVNIFGCFKVKLFVK